MIGPCFGVENFVCALRVRVSACLDSVEIQSDSSTQMHSVRDGREATKKGDRGVRAAYSQARLILI